MQPKPIRATNDNELYRDAGEACADCARICLAALHQHCLSMGGRHVERQHVMLMTDCSEICKTAADFLARGSERHRRICAACADICLACAQECATMDGLEACAAACRRCETACRLLAA